MKCFTAQQSRHCYVGLGEMNHGPGDHPREPIADQSAGSNEVFPRRRNQVERGE